MNQIIKFIPISENIRSIICSNFKKIYTKIKDKIKVHKCKISRIKELKQEIEKGKKELDLAIEQDKEYSYIYKQSIKLDEIINEYMRIAYNIKKD